MSLLLRQVTVNDTSSPHHGQRVDLFIDNGEIKGIGEGAPESAEVIEAEGLYISRGWVDVFADYSEPGYEQKETISSGLATAAKGGYTDVFVLPNTSPVTDNRGGVQYAQQRALGQPVRIHPIGAISQGLEGKALAEMLDMRQFGAVAFSDGWKPVQSAGLMQKALEYVLAFDGTLIQMPVDESLSAGGLMHEGILSTQLGMPGIPSLSESIMVYRDIALLRYTNSRLHFTGISSAESVELIRAAKAEGLKLTASVTPYHLLLTDESLKTYDSAFKVNPPLRTERDRQALIAGLLDGTIDCVTSHHRPQDWDAKAREFEYAGKGMAVQEIVFPLLQEALGSQLKPERLAEVMSTAAAEIFGLPQASIEKGSKGAFTLYAPDEVFTFAAAQSPSLARNNPFDGRSLKGKVHRILN
jgi:dihydroorotase